MELRRGGIEKIAFIEKDIIIDENLDIDKLLISKDSKNIRTENENNYLKSFCYIHINDINIVFYKKIIDNLDKYNLILIMPYDRIYLFEDFELIIDKDNIIIKINLIEVNNNKPIYIKNINP
jgi:hypothetical protein